MTKRNIESPIYEQSIAHIWAILLKKGENRPIYLSGDEQNKNKDQKRKPVFTIKKLFFTEYEKIKSKTHKSWHETCCI